MRSPSALETVIFSISLISRYCAIIRTSDFDESVYTDPDDISWFSFFIADVTLESVSLYAAIFPLSTSMATSLSRPPRSSTSETPSACCTILTNSLSAREYIVDSESPDVIASSITGSASMSRFITTGASASSGRRFFIASTFFVASIAASSPFVPNFSFRLTRERP